VPSRVSIRGEQVFWISVWMQISPENVFNLFLFLFATLFIKHAERFILASALIEPRSPALGHASEFAEMMSDTAMRHNL